MITPLVRDKLKLGERPEQQAVFDALARLYHDNGVLTTDGFAATLADTCPSRETCWDGCRERVSRAARVNDLPGQDGSIFFPWIGAEYRPGGVCVVGWNLNHHGTEWFPLTEEHVISRGSQAQLADGRRKVWGSLFAYRSMASAAAVCDSLAGAKPVIRPSPQHLAGYYDRIARVQAVKCAPLGHRSNPAPEMNAECPPRFMIEELMILRPRALIVFGSAAREAALSVVRRLDDGDPHWLRKTHEGCGRRQSRCRWGPLDLFSMWHPTFARWPQAQAALVAELAAHPLAATRE